MNEPELSGKERIRGHLLAHKYEVVTSRELQDASGILSAPRRVRELRLDEGWPIHSFHDDPNLAADEYRLVGDPPEKPPRPNRAISGRTRAEVLQRDGSTCQHCGATVGDPDPLNPDRTVRLEPHHIDPDGPPDPPNLRTLCNRCNQGLSNIAEAPESRRRVFRIVNRAARADQLAVRDMLNHRYREADDA